MKVKSGKQQQQQLHCTHAWCIRAFDVLVSSWATESREKEKKKSQKESVKLKVQCDYTSTCPTFPVHRKKKGAESSSKKASVSLWKKKRMAVAECDQASKSDGKQKEKREYLAAKQHLRTAARFFFLRQKNYKKPHRHTCKKKKNTITYTHVIQRTANKGKKQTE